MAQPIVLQKHPQPREVCRTCPCVPWETLQCFIPWIICPRGLGQVTAIKATRELILGMALETGLQHCQPGNGEQAPCFWKDHCILDEKKKKLPSSTAQCISTVSCCLWILCSAHWGLLFPLCTFHLGKGKKLNQTVYLGVATLPPCWPNFPPRLRKTAKGQAGCQTAILYDLMPTTSRVQLWGTLLYVKYTLTGSK